jgi:tRNA pseudouridine55 synthase
MATGVLALAVGPATRLVQFLAAGRKHYDATVRLGLTTTTYDVTGTVVAESPLRPTEAAVRAALDRFRGTIEQRPPAYSAKRVGGRRAHQLARRSDGAGIDLPPVVMLVEELTLVDFNGDEARLQLAVSAGFYVRSLAHELGQLLGCGAALARLRRTWASGFGLEQAVTVEAATALPRSELARFLVPPEELLTEWPTLSLTEAQSERARRGLDIQVPPGWAAPPPRARMLDERGRLVALAVPAKHAGFLHPSVVLG